MITGESYADSYGGNATFGRLRPRNNFGFGKGTGWGAWEVGARYSKFDATDFNNSNPQGTGRLGASAPTTVSANEAKAWTLQLKWILNPYTRMLVDYIQTDFNTPVTTNGVAYDTEKAITFRGQFDF
jgi:phosphate-selective porin OprO/OprP